MPRALPWLAALAAAIAVAAVVFWPWLDPRFAYVVDDGFNHLLRLGLLDHLLRQGEWFPRWWPDLTMGYGYPLFTFYSPGAYYLAELYHLLGATPYRAWHLVALTSVALGTGGAFLLAGLIFRSAPAAAGAAVAYVGAPYPFVTNLYNRSAFPEALGLGLLPWLLVAGWLTVRRRTEVALVGLGVAVAALILTHSLSALIGLGVLSLWLAAAAGDAPASERRAGLSRPPGESPTSPRRTPRRSAAASGAARPRRRVPVQGADTVGFHRGIALGAGLGGVALGLALSAFFWLPAFAERGSVHAELGATGNLSATRWLFDPLRPDPMPIETTLSEPYRVSEGTPFDLHWTYPHATSGLLGPPKPGLGQVAFGGLAALAGIVGWLDRHPRPAPRGRAGGDAGRFPWVTFTLCLAAPLGLWLLTTRWAGAVWRDAPLLWVLQFPWRLYGPLALVLALAGAGIFAWLGRRGQPQWVLALLLTLFVAVNGRAAHALERRFEVGAPLPSVADRLRSTEGPRLGAGTTSGGEFLPQTVVLPSPVPPDWSWVQAFEGPFPSGGWIAGRLWPLRGRLRVEGVQTAPSWTAARVEVGGAAGAEVAFRTLVFPGWRAYVDGRPVPLRAAPYDPASGIGHGFAVVAVPPGKHLVQLIAGPTWWSAIGGALALAGLGAGAGALAWPLRRRRWGAPTAILRWMQPVSARWRATPDSPGGRCRAFGWRPVAVISCAAAALFAGALGASWAAVWWPPAPPAGAGEALVLDVLASAGDNGGGAVAGRVTISGGGAVAAGSASDSAAERPWLAMAPPAELRLELDVPSRAVFHAGLGVAPRAGPGTPGAGVRFEVEVADAARRRHTLLTEGLDVPVAGHDLGREPAWRFVEAGLGAFAGQRVTLTLRVTGYGPAGGDVGVDDGSASALAGWATPHVFVDRSARYPPPQAPPTVAEAGRAGD